FSSRRRHTRSKRDWSSDVCSSDLLPFAQFLPAAVGRFPGRRRRGSFLGPCGGGGDRRGGDGLLGGFSWCGGCRLLGSGWRLCQPAPNCSHGSSHAPADSSSAEAHTCEVTTQKAS